VHQKEAEVRRAPGMEVLDKESAALPLLCSARRSYAWLSCRWLTRSRSHAALALASSILPALPSLVLDLAEEAWSAASISKRNQTALRQDVKPWLGARSTPPAMSADLGIFSAISDA
jgi:hypothetical protein